MHFSVYWPEQQTKLDFETEKPLDALLAFAERMGIKTVDIDSCGMNNADIMVTSYNPKTGSPVATYFYTFKVLEYDHIVDRPMILPKDIVK